MDKTAQHLTEQRNIQSAALKRKPIGSKYSVLSKQQSASKHQIVNKSAELASPVYLVDQEEAYESAVETGDISPKARLVSFKNFKFSSYASKARINLNASALPEDEFKDWDGNRLQKLADENIKRNMLDKVDKKQAYFSEQVQLKFSSFVFNDPINTGNGKEHMNRDFYY